MSALFPARASLTPYQGGMIRSDQDGESNNKMAARRGKFNPRLILSDCAVVRAFFSQANELWLSLFFLLGSDVGEEWGILLARLRL